MRCPDCNKFVSFDTDNDPEVNDERVDEAGLVSVEVRIVNTCGECGTELKDTTLNFDVDLTTEVAAHYEEKPECKAANDLSVEIEATRTDRRQTHDRKGKLITNSRYQKQFYGAEAEATVTCGCCSESFTATAGDEVQASSMDELV